MDEEICELIKDWYDQETRGICDAMWGQTANDAIKAANAKLDRRLKHFKVTQQQCNIHRQTV